MNKLVVCSAALWLLYVGDMGHLGKASTLLTSTSPSSTTLEDNFKCSLHAAPCASSSPFFTLVPRYEEIPEPHVLWDKSQLQPSPCQYQGDFTVPLPLPFTPLPLAVLVRLLCSVCLALTSAHLSPNLLSFLLPDPSR